MDFTEKNLSIDDRLITSAVDLDNRVLIVSAAIERCQKNNSGSVAEQKHIDHLIAIRDKDAELLVAVRREIWGEGN